MGWSTSVPPLKPVLVRHLASSYRHVHFELLFKSFKPLHVNFLPFGSLAIEKMRSMDDGFRRQLEAAEKSHREELAQVTQEKEQEVHIAEQKVKSWKYSLSKQDCVVQICTTRQLYHNCHYNILLILVYLHTTRASVIKAI